MNHVDQIEFMAILALSIVGMFYFNGYARRRFDYHFFDLASFCLAVGAFAVIGFGFWLQTQSGRHGSFHRPGSVVAWVGVLIYAKIVFCNFYRTSILLGAVGTVIQFAAFVTAATVLIFPVLISLPMVPVYLWLRNFGAHASETEILYRPQNWYQ